VVEGRGKGSRRPALASCCSFTQLLVSLGVVGPLLLDAGAEGVAVALQHLHIRAGEGGRLLEAAGRGGAWRWWEQRGEQLRSAAKSRQHSEQQLAHALGLVILRRLACGDGQERRHQDEGDSLQWGGVAGVGLGGWSCWRRRLAVRRNGGRRPKRQLTTREADIVC
jgi:hypothetical protein